MNGSISSQMEITPNRREPFFDVIGRRSRFAFCTRGE
jgi:hypothetical protein